jgi:hypothetical protein
MEGRLAMGLVTHHEEPDVSNEKPATIATETDARVALRKQRLAALRRAAGIWANRADIPVDGLQYERAMRDEWQ